MSSITLRLRGIMNKPGNLDLSQNMVDLGNDEAPSLLIYNAALSYAVLKSNALVPFNPIRLWKQVTRIPASELGAIDTYFRKTPLFLSGEEHRTARKTLIDPYKRIERSLNNWLATFTRQFFERYFRDKTSSATAIVQTYLNCVFTEILAKELACPTFTLPVMPTGILKLIPREEGLRSFDQQLENLVNSIKSSLLAAGRNQEEAWPIASVVVMGREPLLSAFLFGLINPPSSNEPWRGENLLRQASPISALSREVVSDVQIDELKLTKGQSVRICPFIAHDQAEKNDHSAERRRWLEFGSGSHLCPGRAISLKITDSFFQEFPEKKRHLIDTSGLKFSRDFLLTTKETPCTSQ